MNHYIFPHEGHSQGDTSFGQAFLIDCDYTSLTVEDVKRLYVEYWMKRDQIDYIDPQEYGQDEIVGAYIIDELTHLAINAIYEVDIFRDSILYKLQSTAKSIARNRQIYSIGQQMTD